MFWIQGCFWAGVEIYITPICIFFKKLHSFLGLYDGSVIPVFNILLVLNPNCCMILFTNQLRGIVKQNFEHTLIKILLESYHIKLHHHLGHPRVWVNNLNRSTPFKQFVCMQKGVRFWPPDPHAILTSLTWTSLHLTN